MSGSSCRERLGCLLALVAWAIALVGITAVDVDAARGGRGRGPWASSPITRPAPSVVGRPGPSITPAPSGWVEP